MSYGNYKESLELKFKADQLFGFRSKLVYSLEHSRTYDEAMIKSTNILFEHFV